MSWGISENASEKEKLFAVYADDIQGMNSCGEIDYSIYSRLFDIGRKLHDDSYNMGYKDCSDLLIDFAKYMRLSGYISDGDIAQPTGEELMQGYFKYLNGGDDE